MIFRLILLLCLLLPGGAAAAEPPTAIVVDASSGSVLWQNGADLPRYPASTTKLMTIYVALQAMAAGEIQPDSQILVSSHAAGQSGSRLGLRTGDRIGLMDALRAMVVRSANDASVAVAESIAVSERAFAARMTETAQQLGMTATGYRNATGMTAAGHQTTARDMAILALALRRDFPQSWPLFASRQMSWKRGTQSSLNGFLTAVTGAEGMKTGFTCSAGYNLVAAANRNGRRIITVILGANSKAERAALASKLTETGFASPSRGPILTSLNNQRGPAPDLGLHICGRMGPGGAPVIPGESTPITLPPVPAGWGVELVLGFEEDQVERWLTAIHRQLADDLGGGTPLVTVKPFHGDLRYRGLVVGLRQDRAMETCLSLRASNADRCLVLSPDAIQAAIDQEWRLRMAMAR